MTKEFICIRLTTTGPNPTLHELTSLCAVIVQEDGEIVDTLELYIKHEEGKTWDPIFWKHFMGHRDDSIAKIDKMGETPHTAMELFEAFIHFRDVSNCAIVVEYGSRDTWFLNHYLNKHGFKQLDYILDGTFHEVFDANSLTRGYMRKPLSASDYVSYVRVLENFEGGDKLGQCPYIVDNEPMTKAKELAWYFSAIQSLAAGQKKSVFE